MTNSATFAAVLDTNVLFPPTLRDTLLYAADDDLFRLVWSDEILQELRRNLVEQAGLSLESAARRVKWMEEAFPQASVIVDVESAPALPDPQDRHVVAAAIAARADFIVTQNRKDFPVAALSPYGVEAVSADSFLVRVLRESPEKMLASLRHHAGLLRNPQMTPAALLEALSLHAPAFARAAREMLEKA